MDVVDPKRDFLLTLNESAQSQIAACIPSPPPPAPHLKKIWGDWGEKGDLGACITGVIVIFFQQEGAVGGCSNTPPPPPPPPKQNRGDWGEKGGLAACIKGVIVIIFFFCRRGRWGPGDAQNRDTSATRQKPKYGPKISLKAHVEGRKTFEKRQCDVLEVCAQEHPAYIIKTLLKPPFSSGMNNRTSSAKLRCQVFADLELAYHVTLFE